MIDATIGGKLFERLKEEATKKGVPVEELMIEALPRYLNVSLDPDEKAEVHLRPGYQRSFCERPRAS